MGLTLAWLRKTLKLTEGPSQVTWALGPQKPGYVKGDSDSSSLHLLLILVKNHDIEKIDANSSPLTFLTLPGHAM